jgi:hypothetical protein
LAAGAVETDDNVERQAAAAASRPAARAAVGDRQDFQVRSGGNVPIAVVVRIDGPSAQGADFADRINHRQCALALDKLKVEHVDVAAALPAA